MSAISVPVLHTYSITSATPPLNQTYRISGTVDGKPVSIRVPASSLVALTSVAAIEIFIAPLLLAAAYPVPPVTTPPGPPDPIAVAVLSVGKFTQ